VLGGREPAASGTPPGDGFIESMMYRDLTHFLPGDGLVKIDRAGMTVGLEARVPLLDHRIVEFAAQLPSRFKIGEDGETKLILKRLLGRYLPKELYDLPKRGFAPPIVDWIRDYYRDHFVEALEDRGGFFEPKNLRSLLGRYSAGKPVNYSLLWHLFSFQNWYNRWTA